MRIYRIVHKKYSSNLFASGMEGRWNSTGKKVIYAAESIPLAFLENMVRRKSIGFNRDFQTMIIEIPPKIKIAKIDSDELEDGWRAINDYSKCQPLGDKWYDASKTLILKVPSAVLPESSNYLVNTEHADFKLAKLVAVTDLIPDERIEDILKKYSGK